MLDKICLFLTILGGLNWGCKGLFEFDIIAWMFGGSASLASRIVYTIIALSSIWCISMLFRRDEDEHHILERHEV